MVKVGPVEDCVLICGNGLIETEAGKDLIPVAQAPSTIALYHVLTVTFENACVAVVFTMGDHVVLSVEDSQPVIVPEKPVSVNVPLLVPEQTVTLDATAPAKLFVLNSSAPITGNDLVSLSISSVMLGKLIPWKFVGVLDASHELMCKSVVLTNAGKNDLELVSRAPKVAAGKGKAATLLAALPSKYNHLGEACGVPAHKILLLQLVESLAKPAAERLIAVTIPVPEGVLTFTKILFLKSKVPLPTVALFVWKSAEVEN